MTSNLPTLPAGWEWKKLADIADIIGGGTPKTEIKEYWNGDIIWLSPTDLGEIGSIQKVNNSSKKISQFGLEKSSAKLLPIGTVLFSSRASIGKIGIADIELSTNQGFANFICKPSIYNYYLAYAFKHFRQDIEDLSNSTTFKEVSKGSLKEFKIPLPPLDEQKRLVSLLDTLFVKIDRSIQLLDENIAAADALLPSALNTVFAVDIIQDWEKYQFDKISKFIDYRGKTPTKTEDGTVLITAKNVRFGYLSDEPKEYIADADYEGWMTRGIPNKGDVIFTTEAPLGNVAILNTNEKRAFAQRIVTFQPISDVYDSNFLYWYMLSPIFQKELYDSATGTTVKGIKTSILKKFKVPLPSLDIQTQTVAYLDSVRDRALRLKVAQNTKKSQLIALKASILDRAFKGEL